MAACPNSSNYRASLAATAADLGARKHSEDRLARLSHVLPIAIFLMVLAQTGAATAQDHTMSGEGATAPVKPTTKPVKKGPKKRAVVVPEEITRECRHMTPAQCAQYLKLLGY